MELLSVIQIACNSFLDFIRSGLVNNILHKYFFIFY